MEGNKELPKICVVVRKRPLSKKEIAKNDVDILEQRNSQTIVAKEFKYKFKLHCFRQKVDLTKFIEEHHFTFDQVFDETIDNEAV